MKKTSLSNVSRRDVLKIGAAGAAAGMAGSAFPMPAIAQTIELEYTLAWLPTGQYTFMSVAKNQLLKSHGIDLQVKRGYGSLAATQAIATGQFDIGSASTAGTLLSVAKGLPLTMLCTHGYDSSMGILVPESSGINEPKDLEGKSIGVTAAGGDTPFLPAYYELVGVDASKVTTVSLDSQIIEQSVINGQVDCMVAFGMSSIPNFITQDFPVKLFPFSAVDLTFYWINTLARPEFLAKEPGLVGDVVAGLLEAQKYVLLNPEEAIEQHLEQHPEMAISDNAELFARLGTGMVNASMVTPIAMNEGLGHQDKDSVTTQADLVQTYLGEEGDAALPPVDSYCTNDFAGKVQLSPEEWDTAKAWAGEYADILGLKL